jgi:hypothetical protein
VLKTTYLGSVEDGLVRPVREVKVVPDGAQEAEEVRANGHQPQEGRVEARPRVAVLEVGFVGRALVAPFVLVHLARVRPRRCIGAVCTIIPTPMRVSGEQASSFASPSELLASPSESS